MLLRITPCWDASKNSVPIAFLERPGPPSRLTRTDCPRSHWRGYAVVHNQKDGRRERGAARRDPLRARPRECYPPRPFGVLCTNWCLIIVRLYMNPEQVVVVGKLIGLAAILLQAIALFISSRLDFGDLSIKVAEEKLPEAIFLDAYNAAKSGMTRSITTEELNLRVLQSSGSAVNNRRILKLVVIIIGISLVFQILAAVVDIYIT